MNLYSPRTRSFILLKFFALFILISGSTASFAAGLWGTHLKPFSAQSPWNSRPVDPVLGDFEIPRSEYFPTVAQGAYSTGAFLAAPDDQSMQVLALPGRRGVWDPDAEEFQSAIGIAHWPAGVLPASGSDGHADIVDPVLGIVHSFFQLRNIDGQWRAAQYAWTSIGGRGWGEPGHYFQGARAAAVPSLGGIIRKHEIDDGDAIYTHALAASLTFNALSANPTYVYPATSADANAATTNTGRIPEGALLMLPAGFDTSTIGNVKLRKVAETLKVYGAYVVDRNFGTPFVIYVENGSNFSLHGNKWDNAVARDLDRIRAALRQVVKTNGWLDGDGKPMEMERRLNLLSMRGAWKLNSGPRVGVFNTWQQRVLFAPASGPAVQTNYSNRNLNPVSWAVPQAGEAYRLTVNASGGARLRLQLFALKSSAKLFDSGELEDRRVVVFNWPAEQTRAVAVVYSGDGGQASSVGGSLVAVDSTEAKR